MKRPGIRRHVRSAHATPFRRIVWMLLLNGVIARTAAVAAEPLLEDNFEDIAQWSVIASEGVRAELAPADGPDGRALRLDFDFQRGSGFCVVRRQVELELPENYRFSFSLRAQAPDNNFEFKLVDDSGENVWWVNRRDFQFPSDWTTIAYKARHFRFAWGPSGGRPLNRLGAIEFAVAAGSGGKGSIWIDSLVLEPATKPRPPTEEPLVSFSSAAADQTADPRPLAAGGQLDWRSAPTDPSPRLAIDFRQVREFGGLVIDWDADDHATDYDVAISDDQTHWETAASMRGSNGGLDYIPMPDGEARHVRISVLATSRNRGVGLRRIQIRDLAFSQSANAVFQNIARETKPGLYPRNLLGRQTFWTVVGVPGDTKEALFDTCGALEVDRGSFRIEPFLFTDRRLITWADAETEQRLTDDYLPVPIVRWRTEPLSLEITAFADGPPGASVLLARYRVHNRSDERRSGSLALAIRPFQVLPPWQELNITGGVTRVDSIARNGRRVVVNDDKVIAPWTEPTAFGASTFARGDVVDDLLQNALPDDDVITDPHGFASAALSYAFDLGPGETRTVVLAVPFHAESDLPEPPESDAQAESRFDSRLRSTCDAWRRELNRATLDLPPSASRMVNTFKATQAYILINADGPAIQPGSRTYERSWMRDGALTSAALLSTGHADKVKTFLEWYGKYQYPNGKIPCVVDHRGPDPVDEHDSTGQFIYALLNYYRFTGDRPFLEAHFPQVVAGVDYLESLRNQRLTEPYRTGPPLQRACYGLVPESISHEGYSAKPMHSYWDSFFVVRGLKDAATIAGLLDRTDLESRFADLRDAYRKSLYDSMRLAMRVKQIDYIPGCVELGDFDATSTAIGIFPCGELGLAPEPQLGNTFSRYHRFFRQRRDGEIEWEAYTPYEVRLVGTFVRLGQPQHAHELLRFFLNDQQPAGWNQWAEVVWRDRDHPGYIGDVPHTWVGSDYLNAVRSLFVYERESDQALVIAAGVLPEWINTPEGVKVSRFPTEYGLLTYSLAVDSGRTVLDLRGEALRPPGGIILESALPGPIRAVTCDGRAHSRFTDREVHLDTSPSHVVIEHGP
ncbi:MAG TPA: discoidin domain-containing protein [Phycisphaerae bacterium]|nr:discoidin domain-containing protein [Phycisphaerae bacterium]